MPDRFPTIATVQNSSLGHEQTQIVVDFSDRPDRTPGTRTAGFLIDAQRGLQSIEPFDIRALQLPEKLPRVHTHRLDVLTLPLGVDRIERQ